MKKYPVEENISTETIKAKMKHKQDIKNKRFTNTRLSKNIIIYNFQQSIQKSIRKITKRKYSQSELEIWNSSRMTYHQYQ